MIFAKSWLFFEFSILVKRLLWVSAIVHSPSSWVRQSIPCFSSLIEEILKTRQSSVVHLKFNVRNLSMT